MSSRQAILDRLRSRILPPAELPPELGFEPIRFDDLVQQFCRSVEAVGGTAVRVGSKAEIAAAVADTEAHRSATQVLGIGVAEDLTNLEAVPKDPHHAQDLDLLIVPGSLGVAENGAVWVTDLQVQPRAALFLTQHLILALPASAILATMHDAYRQIEAGTEDYGVFISGPSKTADIEQSLVLGAHGPRTLTVLLY